MPASLELQQNNPQDGVQEETHPLKIQLDTHAEQINHSIDSLIALAFPYITIKLSNHLRTIKTHLTNAADFDDYNNEVTLSKHIINILNIAQHLTQALEGCKNQFIANPASHNPQIFSNIHEIYEKLLKILDPVLEHHNGLLRKHHSDSSTKHNPTPEYIATHYTLITEIAAKEEDIYKIVHSGHSRSLMTLNFYRALDDLTEDKLALAKELINVFVQRFSKIDNYNSIGADDLLPKTVEYLLRQLEGNIRTEDFNHIEKILMEAAQKNDNMPRNMQDNPYAFTMNEKGYCISNISIALGSILENKTYSLYQKICAAEKLGYSGLSDIKESAIQFITDPIKSGQSHESLLAQWKATEAGRVFSDEKENILDFYIEVIQFEARLSPCFACSQGVKNRIASIRQDLIDVTNQPFFTAEQLQPIKIQLEELEKIKLLEDIRIFKQEFTAVCTGISDNAYFTLIVEKLSSLQQEIPRKNFSFKKAKNDFQKIQNLFQIIININRNTSGDENNRTSFISAVGKIAKLETDLAISLALNETSSAQKVAKKRAGLLVMPLWKQLATIVTNFPAIEQADWNTLVANIQAANNLAFNKELISLSKKTKIFQREIEITRANRLQELYEEENPKPDFSTKEKKAEWIKSKLNPVLDAPIDPELMQLAGIKQEIEKIYESIAHLFANPSEYDSTVLQGLKDKLAILENLANSANYALLDNNKECLEVDGTENTVSLYKPLHQAANNNPKKLITVDFKYNNEDTLKKSKQFFDENRSLIPSNVTVRFTKEVKGSTVVEATIPGLGPIDTHYSKSIEKLPTSSSGLKEFKEWRTENLREPTLWERFIKTFAGWAPHWLSNLWSSKTQDSASTHQTVEPQPQSPSMPGNAQRMIDANDDDAIDIEEKLQKMEPTQPDGYAAGISSTSVNGQSNIVSPPRIDATILDTKPEDVQVAVIPSTTQQPGTNEGTAPMAAEPRNPASTDSNLSSTAIMTIGMETGTNNGQIDGIPTHLKNEKQEAKERLKNATKYVSGSIEYPAEPEAALTEDTSPINNSVSTNSTVDTGPNLTSKAGLRVGS